MEKSHQDSSDTLDPLNPNNAVNDGYSNMGGAVNPSHDEADVSIISSQYNYRQSANNGKINRNALHHQDLT